MFKLLALLAALSGVALGAPSYQAIVPMLDGRIVGGQSVNIANYPYQISLQRSNSHICGTGLISATWSLTAAHCVVGGTISTFSLRGGSSTRNSGGQVLAAAQILLHASYSSSTLDYDIAAIRTASGFTNANARAVALPSAGTGPVAGATATLTGWGATSEGGAAATTLQMVQVPVVSLASCRSSYGTNAITARMFCAGFAAGGRDACQGDSGGPVIVGGVLAGLVSWGNGCARPNFPGAPSYQAIVPMLDGRIVGGQSVNIANYPYQISLQRSNSHICGTGLISATWSLTAAHCVVGGTVSAFSLRGGSSTRNSGGQVLAAAQILLHASYSSSTLDYDIAAIRTATGFTVTDARAVALPSAGSGPVAGATATLTGWGTTSEGGAAATTLQMVQVPVVSQASCRSSYSTSSITDRMFCAGFAAGGRDACQGDSGGPVIVGGVLVGLVSWGNGCARPNFPGVYTNVPALRSWVTAATGL
ncbi:hypothetical protein NQ317_004297 [Molorchus minor]|uniref:Peptidase S1 domain-containing protein n=1 Tax=Molorchus minor TaxID=1323400 RepID=A0ABQ9JGS1_9CUCU|nr:hypothetical protein NQ317_004297 [Molorchus minor]